MRKVFHRIFYNCRGVALLIVLSSLALLSGVVVEFAYNSNVTYNLALNERDRLQAYYLAQSGINFSKLILKFDKETRNVAKQASKKLGQSIQVQPLYKMIPLNTEMIRGMAGLLEEGEGSGEAVEGGEETEGEEKVDQAKESLQEINLGEAKTFLDFEGDFSAEVTEEDSKLNLNAFYSLTPSQKSYDRLKSTLYHLLATPEFEGMFDDRYRGASLLAQSIVDYIDKDDVHNEPGGQERGREGVSGGGAKIQMKNGKLLSLEELIMVPGMTDEIFEKLRGFVTIYGKDEKISLCQSEEPLVRAMILAYTENNPKMEPIKDDNEDLLAKATEAVLNNCPDSAVMSSELDKALGVTEEGGSSSGTTTTTSTSTASAKGRKSTGEEAKKESSGVQFGDLIKDKVEIFSIVSIGTLGESEVKVKTVLDTSKSNPRQWQELYWRVE